MLLKPEHTVLFRFPHVSADPKPAALGVLIRVTVRGARVGADGHDYEGPEPLEFGLRLWPIHTERVSIQHQPVAVSGMAEIRPLTPRPPHMVTLAQQGAKSDRTLQRSLLSLLALQHHVGALP
jgi:hypothetical protein